MANITCIVCPMGCQLVVTKLDNRYKVEGNTCKRGEKYGIEELTNPKRVVTTTVKLKGSYLNLLPVKTSNSIPKEKVFEVMEILDKVEVSAHINVEDIIVENILDTGVNIVSVKSV